MMLATVVESNTFVGKSKPPAAKKFLAHACRSRVAEPSVSKLVRIYVPRVESRLEAVKLPATTAAEKAGLQRNYLHDVLTGRKKSVAADKLEAIAHVLACSVEYLTGASEVIGSPPISTETLDAINKGVPRIATVEPGIMRRLETPDIVPLQRDVRFPTVEHVAFAVKGNAYAHRGITDGSTLLCLNPGDYLIKIGRIASGVTVVVARYDDNGRREIVLRQVEYVNDQPQYLPIDPNFLDAERMALTDPRKVRQEVMGIVIASTVLYAV